MTGRHSTQARPGRAKTAVVIGGAGVASATIAVVILAALGLGSSSAMPQAHGATGHSRSASPPKAPPPATATSRPATVPRHADPLTAAAGSYLSSRAGTVMAAVYDLKTGQTWTLGHGQPQAEASIVKVDILETLLAHSATRLTAGDRTLAAQMIEDSDNDAATSLWDSVGSASGIRAYNTAAGLTHTTPSACVSCPGFPWPGWGLSTTLPTDQIILLRRLVEPSTLLTSAARSYGLSLMENVAPAQRWGVSGGVPAQVTVALKNGWLPLNDSDTDWQINSMGWISGSGRDYLMAVLTTGNPDEQYGIDTISQLATMVWANLG
jgi:beta-lactamase class A